MQGGNPQTQGGNSVTINNTFVSSASDLVEMAKRFNCSNNNI